MSQLSHGLATATPQLGHGIATATQLSHGLAPATPQLSFVAASLAAVEPLYLGPPALPRQKPLRGEAARQAREAVEEQILALRPTIRLL